MADKGSVMKEYRLLEQKRQAGGLTPQEEDRLAQLRDLVGPETGVGLSKPGFDVNAAAARLRESLLPAGLRNRPPPMPEAAPEPEPNPAPSAGAGLEAEWESAPFAPLTETAGLSADALFDPETLGEEPTAEVPAAWDPDAQPYDPNAVAYDPSAQPYDPNAAAYDPSAQPYDPNAAAYDPSAQPYDPNAAAYDPNAQPYDPNAAAYDPSAQPYDPNAVPEWDAAVQPAWDPGLAAPWGDAPVPDADPAGLEGEAPSEVDVDGALAPALPMEVEPELAVEPEAEEFLPFDAAAVSAIAPDAAPEGWGTGAPSGLEAVGATFDGAADDDLAGHAPHVQVDPLPSEEALGLLAPLGAGQELTSEDDAFAQGFQLESNGSFGSDSAPAEPAWNSAAQAGETENWESAPSLDLEAMAPDGDVPPIDLSSGEVALAAEVPTPFLAPAVDSDPAPALAPPYAPDVLEEIDVEDLPVVDGADLLEEIPPEPVPERAPPPAPAAVPVEVAPPPASAASPVSSALPVRIEGVHRVVVHTVEGQVKRGSIADANLDGPTLPLAPQPAAPPEELPTAKVKAIFFMLSPGEKAPAAEGKKVRVTFTDGRQIAGFSPDYSDAGVGFFMIPADTRTNTGRIWVYRAAVKSVAVS